MKPCQDSDMPTKISKSNSEIFIDASYFHILNSTDP